MNYPLTLRIQVFSLSAKIEVVDALHSAVCFVRKHRFKFREHVTVLGGPPSRSPLCEIQANPSGRFPVRYCFTLPQGTSLGAVSRANPKQHPLYLVQDGRDQPAFEIQPKNPRAWSADRLFAKIPCARLLSTRLLRPRFSVRSCNQQELFVLRKQAAPLASLYFLQPSGETVPLSQFQESLLLMAILVIVFLEG